MSIWVREPYPTDVAGPHWSEGRQWSGPGTNEEPPHPSQDSQVFLLPLHHPLYHKLQKAHLSPHWREAIRCHYCSHRPHSDDMKASPALLWPGEVVRDCWHPPCQDTWFVICSLFFVWSFMCVPVSCKCVVQEVRQVSEDRCQTTDSVDLIHWYFVVL